MARGRGHPRMTLDEAVRQWHGPRRQHVERHAKGYLRAFYRHLLALRPECLRTWADVYDLAYQVREELPCLHLPPFADPSEHPTPSMVPTVATAGPPPGIVVMPTTLDPGQSVSIDDFEPDGARWRREHVERGTTVAVEHGGTTLHFGEHIQCMLAAAFGSHVAAWFEHWRGRGVRPPPDYVTDDEIHDEASRAMMAALGNLALAQAETYVTVNPDARILGAPPPPPGMYDGWPPAQPTDEPRMDDGSHLLASERGRRRIDPETGKRMIRTMVLTADAWPHWEWSEDVEGPGAVGPWGPDVSIGTPDQPAQMSPRESMRPYLARAGRLDLLHKYTPWPGDPPL